MDQLVPERFLSVLNGSMLASLTTLQKVLMTLWLNIKRLLVFWNFQEACADICNQSLLCNAWLCSFKLQMWARPSWAKSPQLFCLVLFWIVWLWLYFCKTATYDPHFQATVTQIWPNQVWTVQVERTYWTWLWKTSLHTMCSDSFRIRK